MIQEHIPTKQSLVTPWFEQPGGGVQYKFDKKISKLADKKDGVKLKLIGEYK